MMMILLNIHDNKFLANIRGWNEKKLKHFGNTFEREKIFQLLIPTTKSSAKLPSTHSKKKTKKYFPFHLTFHSLNIEMENLLNVTKRDQGKQRLPRRLCEKYEGKVFYFRFWNLFLIQKKSSSSKKTVPINNISIFDRITYEPEGWREKSTSK